MRSVPFLLILLLLPFASQADDLSEYGELVSIEFLTADSDQYALFRGRVTLQVNDIDTLYTWGGSTCNNRDLSDAQVTQLQNALLAPYMRVRFRTKIGQGANLCIVGFEITNEKFLT